MSVHVSIVLLSLVLVLVNTEIQPFCDVDNYVTDDSDPQLPQFPDQFYYSMEALLVERNQTVFVQEYFDEIGNRGRIDFKTDRGQSSAISDYTLAEAFVFPNTRTGEECSVSNLTNNITSSRFTQFLFGIVHGDNNSVHIGAPSFIFYNNINMSKVNHLGINSSRAIPSHHWQTCFEIDNNSFTLDYYFTDSDLWNNSYGVQGYIPVTIELRGTRLSSIDNSTINIEHYYNFVEYNTGNKSFSDDTFMVPTGLICSGRIPGMAIPSFPNYFSAGIETIVQNSITSYQEYYDLTHNLFRIDGYTDIPDYYTGTFTSIQDYNSETSYFFTYNSSSRCDTSPLLYDYVFYNADIGSDGDIHLKSLQSLFYIDDSYDYVYEGISMENGIPIDVWIAQNLSDITIRNKTYSNSHYEIYITHPGQQIRSIYGYTTDPVLFGTKYVGTETTTYSNGSTSTVNISSMSGIFSYSRVEPPIDVFDISQCLTSGQYAELRMSIDMTTKNINQNNLKQDIRAGITEYAKSIQMPFLSPLQVSSIRVYQSDDDNHTHIHVHIANISDVAVKKWDYSANDIVNRMLRNIEDGDQLPFTIRVNDVNVVLYYREDDDSEESSAEGVSKGAVAGISIGTFIIGILVGIVVGFFVHLGWLAFFKRKGSVEFNSGSHEKYERQIDDIPISDD